MKNSTNIPPNEDVIPMTFPKKKNRAIKLTTSRMAHLHFRGSIFQCLSGIPHVYQVVRAVLRDLLRYRLREEQYLP